MKGTKFLLILGLAVMAVILVVRPFNGKVAGLASDGEPYDPYFQAANDWFDSVAHIHDQDMPILEKIESKLHYIGLGLTWEKDGKMVAFDTLERKLDRILGKPGGGLPPQAITAFWNANYNFDSVATVHSWKGDLPSAVKDSFSFSNAYFDTVALIHNGKLFADSSELWRIEEKLSKLNQALKHEKHAKRGAFVDLEAKLDTLLGEPYIIPKGIEDYFDTADIYFDSVDVVHQQVGGLTDETDMWFYISNEWFDSVNYLHEFPPFPDEWMNIEWKIHYLKYALKFQKEGKHFAFRELEAKLDTLLGWEFIGLPQDVEYSFSLANAYLDSVNWVHDTWPLPELPKIEQKLHYLKMALKWQKEAKHRMFWELEFKLDSLLHKPFEGLPQEVEGLFGWANSYFDSVNMIHDGLIFQGAPEDWKIMQKLHYFKYALKHQKEAMWLMFNELEVKLDMLAEPRTGLLPGLPPVIDSLFVSSNVYFDSVNFIYNQTEMPIPLKVEWMLHYFKHALKDEKDAKWKAFDELKRKAYEFDKVELKVHYLTKALQYQKDAKRLMFTELENKLDQLLGAEPGGLPQGAEADFQQANYFFDLADSIHWKSDTTEIVKIEQKLLFLRDALIYQKHAVWKMFDTLSVKIDLFAQLPHQDLDQDIVADFYSADAYFADSIIQIEQMPGLTELQKIEAKIYYLSQGMQLVKDAKEKMFGQWKQKLFEFDKIEKKLYYLGKGSKYQKEAKEAAFLHLEEKLDTLFAWRGWDPLIVPKSVLDHFDSANAHFGQVSSIHDDITLRELAKIEMKIDLLNSGFKFQKDATWTMFLTLEEKLDLLLERSFVGLPDSVDASFASANYCFDSVSVIHDQQVPPGLQLEQIESMLDVFSRGLKFAKEAKWWMFDELEEKIDSLIETGVREKAEGETVPERFVLLQNYPNPFNPTTNIEFTIPQPAHVKLEIFNVLGKKVATLVDEKLSAGYKIVEWDGKDDQEREVSTGIYFYRLKAGDFTQTRKMILLK